MITLTARQEKFCRLRVADPAATYSQTFKDAGYASRGVETNVGHLMALPYIKARIVELEGDRFSVEVLAATLDGVMENLATVGVTDIRDTLLGNSSLLMHVSQMSPTTARMILEQDVDAETGVVTKTKYKRRLPALKALARASGLMDKWARAGAADQTIYMSLDAAEFNAYVDKLVADGKRDLLNTLIEQASRDNVRIDTDCLTRAASALERMA